jgi:hypothetical protein
MQFLLSEIRLERVSQWLYAATAVGAIVAIAVLLIPRRRNDPPSRRNDPTPAQERAVERDMQNLLHELSEMSRRVNEQLDARAARLEALIREADERIARLSEPVRSPIRDDGPMIMVDDVDPRHTQIYSLADQGLTPRQIAERMHMPEGEVGLIVALRTGRRVTTASHPNGLSS